MDEATAGGRGCQANVKRMSSEMGNVFEARLARHATGMPCPDRGPTRGGLSATAAKVSSPGVRPAVAAGQTSAAVAFIALPSPPASGSRSTSRCLAGMP
jgi:hypothetical protein